MYGINKQQSTWNDYEQTEKKEWIIDFVKFLD